MEVINPVGGIKPVSKYLFAGLLLFFILEYVRPGSYLPALEAAKLNTIIPLSVFVLTFFSGGGIKNSEVLKAGNTKWFMLFLCLFAIQIFTVDVRQYTFDAFKTVLGYLFIYFVIIKQVNTVGRIKSIFAVLIMVHIALVILNPNLILQPEQRNYIMGVPFLGDGNDFAWSVCIVVPFAICLLQASTWKLAKMFWIASTCLLILVVVGTQSRGGSIALGVTLLYLILKGKKKIMGLIGILMVLIVVLAFAPQAYYDRMASISDYETEGSAQGRIMAWKSAMRMAMDHPIVGVGAGHFSVKYGVEYRPPGVGITEIPWSNAHSIYFMVLGEFGFAGLIIILGLITFNLLRNRKLTKYIESVGLSELRAERSLMISLQASLIGFAVGGAFLSGIYYPHLYILAALLESAYRICSQRQTPLHQLQSQPN